MSLQDIIKKIQADAQSEVEKIQAGLEQQKKTAEGQAAEAEQESLQVLKEKTNRALKSVDEKTLSMARRENRRLKLATKRRILDGVMQSLLQSLEGADEATYKNLMQALLEKLPFGKGTLHVPEQKVEVMKGLAKEFLVQADKDVSSGFILKHQGVEVDNSFENLIFSEYRSELEIYFIDQLKLS